jgi:probable LLM family oxidoreductase
MELGLYTLSDLSSDPSTRVRINAERRIKETIAAAQLADEVGLDVFGIGEHHRLDFAVPSPAVILGAVANATKRIRLTSAVTVLSAADPVRVFEDFSLLDLISHGRAELIVGRGVFTEPFPLFGFDLDDYHALFEEKLDLLQKLNQARRITWSGQFRSSLRDAEISPRPHQAQLPLWVGVGGSPESAVRAGELGLPMALAVLGGPITRIAGTVTLYREAGRRAGHPQSKLKVSLNSHAYVGEDPQNSRNIFRPYYQHYMSEFLPSGRKQIQISESEFALMTAPTNALMVGSAQEVVDKIIAEYEIVHHDRFLAQIDIGGLPYSEVAKVIERFGDRVAPIIRKETMAAISTV